MVQTPELRKKSRCISAHVPFVRNGQWKVRLITVCSQDMDGINARALRRIVASPSEIPESVLLRKKI